MQRYVIYMTASDTWCQTFDKRTSCISEEHYRRHNVPMRCAGIENHLFSAPALYLAPVSVLPAMKSSDSIFASLIAAQK